MRDYNREPQRTLPVKSSKHPPMISFDVRCTGLHGNAASGSRIQSSSAKAPERTSR